MELTQEEIIKLFVLPDTETIQGKRDYLILSMLCHGINKPRIARSRAYDFAVEGDQLIFNDKKGKIPLSSIDRWMWDGYVRMLTAKVGVDFVKTKPVFTTLSTNELKGRNKDFGITPEAIQQTIERYFRKAGIDKKPSAGIFKQAKPIIQQKITLEKEFPKKFIQKGGVASPRPLTRSRRNKKYRNKNRYAHYKHRLLESKFCFDANFLTSKGFFKGGLGGHNWSYTCRNENGYIGQAKIALIKARHPDEVAVRIAPSPSLLTKPSTVRVMDENCQLGGRRWCFYCPQCNRKVFTLFYHYVKDSRIETVLACRRCHRLLYLSQVKGINRIGLAEYARQKELCKNTKDVRQITA